MGRMAAAEAVLARTCARDPASTVHCRVDRIQLYANNGRRAQARSELDALARDRHGGDPSRVATGASLLAAMYIEVGDFAEAAKWQRIALEEGDWFPTSTLLAAAGGAKLPAEMSRDPAWLAVWADPRLRDVVANYTRNLQAWRACSKAGTACP
jgi:hypothetical protein